LGVWFVGQMFIPDAYIELCRAKVSDDHPPPMSSWNPALSGTRSVGGTKSIGKNSTENKPTHTRGAKSKGGSSGDFWSQVKGMLDEEDTKTSPSGNSGSETKRSGALDDGTSSIKDSSAAAAAGGGAKNHRRTGSNGMDGTTSQRAAGTASTKAGTATIGTSSITARTHKPEPHAVSDHLRHPHIDPYTHLTFSFLHLFGNNRQQNGK
jgi:hypothetical protein